MKNGRMINIALVVVFAASILKTVSDKERDLLSVESIEIKSEKMKKPKKIVFLSDLHDKEFGDGNTRLIKEVAGLKPDMILIGGDTMNVRRGKLSLRVTEELLRNLTVIAPVCYGNGNNEQRMIWEKETFGDTIDQFYEILKKYHVHYLSDSFADIGNIRISGIDLKISHYNKLVYEKLTKEYLNDHIGAADLTKFNILLCHSPSFLEACSEWGADLVLSGHAHGGTIRFPTDWRKKPGKIDNDRGLISSQLRLFHKYCAGVFQRGRTCMIVSRGLGTHTVNIRINNKPQIVVVNLMSE